MKVAFGAQTDVGLKRQQNEDSLCADPKLGLFVVCDGMGGRNAGEVASRLAVTVIQKHLRESCEVRTLPIIGEYSDRFSRQTNRLASAVRLANQIVNGASASNGNLTGMGTTAVSALMIGQTLSLAHVGDSRIYLIRGGTIQALTRDHTLVAEQVRQGVLTEEEAEESRQKHIITRALGIEEDVEVDLDEVTVRQDDVLILCSDGLTSGVKPSEILKAVQSEEEPQAASERLVSMANAAGGLDNTTVIVVAVKKLPDRRLWKKIWKGAKSE
ncbi:Stp1/IreP family PP2C-type Ser/Thr phosphatase [Nitrospiraceae bacterium AH_259_D15_M11_P09]|nr:Stp1/IreP family PP2C-type Ser/Thr phosphatase [Nitrospiraceae bacterium AH_259_D15_M11_P09]